MASRARELLDRSRVLLDRSRVAAAQYLTAPPKHPVHTPAAGPALAQLPPPAPAVVPEAPADDAVLAEICASVALRDLNLLDQLLARLEELEAGRRTTTASPSSTSSTTWRRGCGATPRTCACWSVRRPPTTRP